MGYIRRKIISCTPEFTIYDASHKKVLRISGPFCLCGCEHEFMVTSMDGHEVGEIKKKFSGFGRELFTNADKFGVTFPVDLDVKVKALLVGATLLVVIILFIFIYLTNVIILFCLFFFFNRILHTLNDKITKFNMLMLIIIIFSIYTSFLNLFFYNEILIN